MAGLRLLCLPNQDAGLGVVAGCALPDVAHIPGRPLEELVWRDLCEVLATPEMVVHAMERARGGHWLPQAMQARRANFRRARAGLHQQIERLTEAYLAGVVPLSEYERRRRDAEARLAALDGQERELTHDTDRQAEIARLAADAEAFCQRVRQGLEQADFARKRELLELLIDRIVVTDETVEIRYVIPVGPEGERDPFCLLRTDYQHLISIRQQWSEDADLTTIERRARLSMDYDFKRRIEAPSEREGLLATDETLPWRTADEFMAYRDDMSRWHRAEARILKTAADLAAFEAWRQLGRGRRAAGMRHVSSAQPPLLVMLLRASTQGELGFAKRPHREIIEHLTGYRITRDMLKKAADPRRGGVAPVIELGSRMRAHSRLGR